ncbi:MAG: nitrilase-related carbon-nitrogen hydrolase [candidate division KSB1 bacterium]|nr:nitrilase-related carbon-nitrogen hydrolase [candidate division KSB1 bacterium]
MNSHKICLAQTAPVLGNLQRNKEKHLEFCEQAIEQGAMTIAFPELALTGYHFQEQTSELALQANDAFWDSLKEISRHITIITGCVLEERGPFFYNAAVVLAGGQVQFVHRKVYLPTYRIFEEGKWFARGNTWRTFENSGYRTGILICEESWHLLPAYILFLRGVDVLFILTNSMQTTPNLDDPVSPACACRTQNNFYARMLQAYVFFVNRAGEENGRRYWGGSEAIAPDGRLLGRAGDGEQLLYFEVDAAALREQRIHTPLRRDEDLHLALQNINWLIQNESLNTIEGEKK